MEKERQMRLMREGNAFYEVDEECLRKGLNREEMEEERRNERGEPQPGRYNYRNR